MFRQSYSKCMSLLLCAAIGFSSFAPIYAQETQDQNSDQTNLRDYIQQSGNNMSALDKDILKKEVELIKLNAEFFSHYTKGSKWKKRRMNFYDAAAGTVANVGDIILMSQFYRYYKNPGEGLAHKGRLQCGALIVLVAYLTLGGMYAGEGAYDLINDYKGKRKGFDAKTVYNRALTIKTDLDKLFAQRDAQCQSASSDSKAAMVAEGNVLKDIRDLALIEFSKIYVDSRKKRVARDLTTLGTLAVCATGAFPGAYNVMRGVKQVNLKKVGGGGVGFLVSGSILTAAPVLIHGGAAIQGKVSNDKVKKNLIESRSKTVAALKDDVKTLGQLSAQAGEKNQKPYEMLAQLLNQREEFLQKLAVQQKREVIESFVSYLAKGGPQIAWGTMLTRAGYRHRQEPVQAFRGIAQAATVNEVSWATWMLDTFQREVRDEVKNHKNGKKPAQSLPFGVENTNLVELENIVR